MAIVWCQNTYDCDIYRLIYFISFFNSTLAVLYLKLCILSVSWWFFLVSNFTGPCNWNVPESCTAMDHTGFFPQFFKLIHHCRCPSTEYQSICSVDWKINWRRFRKLSCISYLSRKTVYGRLITNCIYLKKYLRVIFTSRLTGRAHKLLGYTQIRR